MKILFINSVYGIKSTGRIVSNYVKKLEEQGHKCRVAYGRENVPNELCKNTFKICNDFELRISGLEARISDNVGFSNIKSTKKFLKWADDFDPDILWMHNLHGYYINVEMLFSWIKSRSKMKVYWTLHDCWAFTGHCSNYQIVGCEKWKTGCKECMQKNSYPMSYVDFSQRNYNKKKACFQNVANMTIIVPSFWLQSQVEKSFLSEYRLVVHHNKIDLSAFSKKESDFRKKYCLENKYVILGVQSSWTEAKGIFDFDALTNKLDDTYKIVLVGVSDKQSNKISDNILCIPKTNNVQELAEIYSAADVFLNLTYQDNYPTVNLEAQACGTPCITYRTGGSPESVPCENVVEKGNLDRIINKIINRKYAPAIDTDQLFIGEPEIVI